MQLSKPILIALLSCTQLIGCAWFRGEEDVVITSPLPHVDNQFHPKIVWNSTIGIGSKDFYTNLQPAWLNARVFVADRYGIVKALDLESGKEIWSTDLSIHHGFFARNTSAQLTGGVTAVADRIYVGSELAKVYIIDAQDGSLIREIKVTGEALSEPVVTDGIVLVHTSNGILQALNEADGTMKWTVNFDVPALTLRGESAPTPAFGAAIVGGDNGFVSAVMLNNGKLIWKTRISLPHGTTEIGRISDVQTTPVVVNGVVYALAYNGNLAALDLRSGQIRWSRDIGSVSNLLVENDRIYLVDQNDHVIAVDTESGTTLWNQSELLHRNLTSPVLYNGYIVTGDSEGYLHWINTDNGRFVAQQKVDSAGLLATPIVASDKLIVQAKNGKLYAMTH